MGTQLLCSLVDYAENNDPISDELEAVVEFNACDNQDHKLYDYDSPDSAGNGDGRKSAGTQGDTRAHGIIYSKDKFDESGIGISQKIKLPVLQIISLKKQTMVRTNETTPAQDEDAITWRHIRCV